jgi:hypothetical protein
VLAGQQVVPVKQQSPWQQTPVKLGFPVQLLRAGPQHVELVKGSWHVPLQSRRPFGQTQPPSETLQILPPVQTVLQPPQFCGSFNVSTHVLLHSVWPAGQT